MGNREGFLKENLLNSCVNFSNKRKMILKRAPVMSMIINPYRQIPETISKKPAVTQGIWVLRFWGVTQGIFRKLFPKKCFAVLWRHYVDDNWKGSRGINRWHQQVYFQTLEKVSGKSPESRPKIAKSGKSLEKVSGISPESPPAFWK